MCFSLCFLVFLSIIIYESLFKISIRMAKRIEKMVRDFLCEGCGEGKRDHLVSWEVVSHSKLKGGLAVGNIIARSIALTWKWLWRFLNESGSLWYAVIESKYGIIEDGWDSFFWS